MAGTRRRTAASRSTTSQAPRSTIQILQSRIVSILEPVNLERSDAILDTATRVRAATALNATTLPPPLSQPEDAPFPSPQAPTPPETNKVLTDQVNLPCQQNDRLECVDKNHEKILTVIATHIEESQRNKNLTTPMVVDCATSTPVNRHRKSKKPPEDSDEGSRGTRPLTKT